MKNSIRWPMIAGIFLTIGLLFFIGLKRLNIDTDVVKSLPQDDPVVADGRYVIMHHPVQERVVIDISCNVEDINALIRGAVFIEERLKASGLFKDVGLDNFQKLFPDLLYYVSNNLPGLFSEYELKEKIGPLLGPGKVSQSISENYTRLSGLDGIGQIELIKRDPLGFRNFVLAKLSHLAPAGDAQIIDGQLVSSDNRHLLIVTLLKNSGSDTRQARKIADLISNTSIELNNLYKEERIQFILTPVGAYRAALDNETISKKDTQKALLFATAGIILLLILAFPRPYVGILALLPAFVGIMLSLFIMSLFRDSISILAIGFGGAIVSITVDHGIAFLLFLDRPHKTIGRHAAKEVWSIGLIATLTTVGAFSFLFISGFPILTQIGQFAALGILFSFIFVHTVFPIMFPDMAGANRDRPKILPGLVDRLVFSGGKKKAFGALFFALIMLFFINIEFHMDLSSMNTVSAETGRAEEMIKKTWGDIFNKVFIMSRGNSIRELQQKGDSLLMLLNEDIKKGVLTSAFIPSMIFPGESQLNKNFLSWKNFWSNRRVSKLKNDIKISSQKLGFTPKAFQPFFNNLEKSSGVSAEIPIQFFSLLGISKMPRGNSWLQISTLSPGPSYDAGLFHKRYTSTGKVKVFDPTHFSKSLGMLLSDIFKRMAVIIGICVIFLLFIFFLDIKLTLIALAPIVFAMISTLGTLNLIGHSLDIPALMLSIIIFGMGVDYSLFFVRSYQRYMHESHPSLGLIRLAVFLAAASTLVGFGILSMAEHSLLRSAGLTSLLGIGYSLAGAFFILPPVLNAYFKPRVLPAENVQPGSKRHISRTLYHYRKLEPYPRLFARFKLKLDPMFPGLADFLKSPERIIDIGCGYAVPSVWLLELFPDAGFTCIEPDSERIRVASHVIGDRGEVIQGMAPDLPEFENADTVLMLDMIHYLNDHELSLTLKKINNGLIRNGRLIIRVTIPSEKRFAWERWMEYVRVKVLGIKAYFRTEEELKSIISEEGLTIDLIEPSIKSREETWIIAGKKDRTAK